MSGLVVVLLAGMVLALFAGGSGDGHPSEPVDPVDPIPEGTKGNDIFLGTVGDDYFFGNDGKDYLEGGSGDDTLRGGTGTDTIFGGAGNDYLEGGSQRDSLYGGDGDDMIDGRVPTDYYGDRDVGDTIDGGAGNDTIVCGGADHVVGGAGDDQFEVFEKPGFLGVSFVEDFTPGEDVLIAVYDEQSGDMPVWDFQVDPGPDPAGGTLLINGTPSAYLVRITALDQADVVLVPGQF